MSAGCWAALVNACSASAATRHPSVPASRQNSNHESGHLSSISGLVSWVKHLLRRGEPLWARSYTGRNILGGVSSIIVPAGVSQLAFWWECKLPWKL